jgi:hypothetical protein
LPNDTELGTSIQNRLFIEIPFPRRSGRGYQITREKAIIDVLRRPLTIYIGLSAHFLLLSDLKQGFWQGQRDKAVM